MLNGKEKFNQALSKASILLAKKNIKVDEEELTALIEEAVVDCKELFETKRFIEEESETRLIQNLKESE